MEFESNFPLNIKKKSLKNVEVSVVIPFFKNKKWLKEAIESVFCQNFTDFEIIVINDGSPEDISKLEVEYPSVRFEKIENSGPGKARNIGISIAAGKYVAFLDADDIWNPNKLRIQTSFMNQTNFMWSHSNYIKFWDDSDAIQKINCQIEGNLIPKMFLACPIATPCVMIRQSILKDNLQFRFSEIKRIGEDSYFWFKIAEHYPLGFIEDYLTNVRIRGNNAAIQAYTQLKSRADNYEFIIAGRKYYKNIFYFKLVKFGYLMCKYGFNLIDYLTKTFNIKNTYREVISKIIYAFPYMYIKTLSFINKK